MNRLNPITVGVVAGILALLLIVYVFAGGSSRPENPDRLSDKDAARANKAPDARCASKRTYDLIKAELFRRAAELGGRDRAEFLDIAPYSVLRVTSPTLASQDEDAATLVCSGSLALELPPGLVVAGGQRALTAQAGYALQFTPGDGGETLTLTNADTIITPLATLARAESAPAAADPDSPSAAPSDSSARPGAPPRPEPRPAPRAAPPRETPRATTPPARATPSPAPPPSAHKPSFNCRYAQTRGEIAVCSDGGLATLDRQMAGVFNRAMSAASPAQRSLLQRTRGNFLRYRDSCASEACMAGAYRDRMREIGDIMAGRWSPP